MLIWFLSCNIPLYIGKNPVKKLCKVLEMELKTYTPVALKFVFEKIKFKILHYIQRGFIRQRPGLSKDQITMLKSLVITISSSNIVTYSIAYIKGDKYFFFYISRCRKCSPETKLHFFFFIIITIISILRLKFLKKLSIL